MKSLTVKQPWAWAIIAGKKPIENRSWSTAYRGRLVIVAGKSAVRSYIVDREKFLRALCITPPEHYFHGYAIGTVDLIDVVSVSEAHGPFAEGPYCWILRNPAPFRSPLPYQGHLSLREFVSPTQP